MHEYFSMLEASELPLSVPGLAGLWAVALVVTYVLQYFTEVASAKQAHFTHLLGRPHRLNLKYLLGQVASAAVVFFLAGHFGGPTSVLFAGGWTLVALYVVASNLRSLAFALSLSRPTAALGSVAFGSKLTQQSQSAEYFAGALLSLFFGLLLTHLAPLGAALVLAASSAGMYRRSRSASDA